MDQYNDKKNVEKVLREGFGNRYVSQELRKLALHLRDEGLKPKQRREKIYEICEEHIEDFNRVKFFQVINSAIRFSTNRKNKLITVESIDVTQAELDYIDNLDVAHIYKKILFTIIVMDKLKKAVQEIIHEKKSDDEYYLNSETNRKLRELKKSSTVSRAMVRKDGHRNIHSIFYYFNQLELVKSNIGNIKLLFMYDIPKDSFNAINITDFDNIGFYYDQHIGEKNIKECEECKRMMRVRSNKNKYCVPCGIKVDREKARMRMELRRSSK